MSSLPVLDTLVRAETPEGILLDLRPAGLAARGVAFLLDLVIRMLLTIAIWVTAGWLLLRSQAQGVVVATAVILWFALEWFYPVVFELSRWGATPGKLICRLQVVMDSGLPVTPAASLTRNLLRVVDFMPALYGAAVASMLLRPDFKRLGDLAAATLVVYRPPKLVKLRAIGLTSLASLAPLAPAIPVAAEDQAAVMALAERAPYLTSERVDELSAIAARISGDEGRKGPEVTARVLAVAQWFLGRRSR
jgi:uncharacterized RDD family membrane protein YckC